MSTSSRYNGRRPELESTTSTCSAKRTRKGRPAGAGLDHGGRNRPGSGPKPKQGTEVLGGRNPQSGSDSSLMPLPG